LPEETRLYIPSVTMGVLKGNPEETLKKEEAKELIKKNEKIDEVLADL
jgi:HEPN domain-containing protein